MKINIRKSLLACMASMTLISFTAYGSEQSDQDQILREIAERIAASGDILDKIQEGAPWEDVQKLVEDLKPMDVGGPGLDSEEGESRGASMTGAMVGAGGTDFGGGSSSNINLELARLQIQLANSTKDTMTPYMNEINRIQEDQNRAGSFLSQARQIQKSAESSRKSIAMPDTMKFYMDTNKISYPKSNQGPSCRLRLKFHIIGSDFAVHFNCKINLSRNGCFRICRIDISHGSGHSDADICTVGFCAGFCHCFCGLCGINRVFINDFCRNALHDLRFVAVSNKRTF